MRIATWNLAGRWDARHRELIEAFNADVLLLTEVSERVDLPGLELHATEGLMAARRHWAAIGARNGLSALPDPHGASVMARIGKVTFCSSILPWRNCGQQEPWVGANTAEKTIEAVDRVTAAGPDVWGGDWNHALLGREWTGSKIGRAHIQDALRRLSLRVVTTDEPHQLEGTTSIDHIAIPVGWTLKSVERRRATVDGAVLSDHDAYVVEAHGPSSEPDGRSGAKRLTSPQRVRNPCEEPRRWTPPEC